MKSAAIFLSIALATSSINMAKAVDRAAVFAKLPDWSGLWEQFETGASGGPDDPADFAAANAPLNPPYNASWRKQSKPAAKPADYACVTLGFPGLMLQSVYMFEALVTPNETALAFDFGETRHIYTDGKPLPPLDELVPSSWGTSVGHWEGQTLVVDTAGTDSDIDPIGDRLSSHAVFHERIKLTDNNHLEDQITIIDPNSLTASWHVTRVYHRVPNMRRIIEEECQGNERDVKVNGTFTIAPATGSSRP